MHFTPHRYQQNALNFLARHPFAALLADPGTGKTAIMLALIKWIKSKDPRNRVLVLSTLRVVTEVWPTEIAKWDLFCGLSFKALHGARKGDAALAPLDIYGLNVEGLPWASATGLLKTFDTLVVDESSIVKNWTSKRMGLLKAELGGFSRRHIMTGSPTPLSLHDYFSQQYVVDLGETLGTTITAFRRGYLYDAAPPKANYQKWRALPGAMDTVKSRVSPYVFRLDGEQLLELPEFKDNDIQVTLPLRVLVEYKRELEASKDPLRCLYRQPNTFLLGQQLAGGFYPDGSTFHSAKLDRLVQLVDELSGEPLLVCFAFRAEGEAIARRFDCPLVYGGVSAAYAKEAFRRWNARELPVLALSPGVGGHGLNLQAGGHHICHYSLTTNADQYYQVNRRLRRQGQRSGVVFVHRLLCPGTADKALVALLEGKTNAQQEFLDGIGIGP